MDEKAKVYYYSANKKICARIVIALSVGIGACWWICLGNPALAILGFSIGFACGNTTL